MIHLVIVLDNNTLLEITWEDNLKYVHFVFDSEDDCCEDCLSFVLRDAQTFMNPETKFKYGIGARFSTYEERMKHSDIEPIDMRHPIQKDEIVRMYNFENNNDMSENTFDYSAVRMNTV